VVYLDHGSLAREVTRLTLLGRDSEHHYFALPVDDPLQQRLLEAQPGAAFHELRQAATGLHENTPASWLTQRPCCTGSTAMLIAASAGHPTGWNQPGTG
jgi:hypothetical protein